MKYFLINGVGLKKLLVGTKTVDLPVIHNDDPIRILDAGNTLCDDQLGGIRDLLSKSTADPCVCGSIYCTGGVIQDQYLRLLQKSTGDTETLLLASGNIGAALFNEGVVFVRHFFDEIIGTGKLACAAAFLLCGIFVTPAEIFQNGS